MIRIHGFISIIPVIIVLVSVSILLGAAYYVDNLPQGSDILQSKQQNHPAADVPMSKNSSSQVQNPPPNQPPKDQQIREAPPISMQTTPTPFSPAPAPKPALPSATYAGWVTYSDSNGRFVLKIPTSVPVLVTLAGAVGTTVNKQPIGPGTPYVIDIIPLDTNDHNDFGNVVSTSALMSATDLEQLTIGGASWALGTETPMNAPAGQSVAVGALSDLHAGLKLYLIIEGPKDTSTYKALLQQLMMSVQFSK